MGQILRRYLELENGVDNDGAVVNRFLDLVKLLLEISMVILFYLDVIDLCLVVCVWNNLVNDEVLWMG